MIILTRTGKYLKIQWWMNNSIGKIGSTSEEMNSRLSDTEEHLCDLKGRMMEH